MQPVSTQRIGKHAYNNKIVVGGSVFCSVRAKWLEKTTGDDPVQVRVESPAVKKRVA
jgi:hypothetical protein